MVRSAVSLLFAVALLACSSAPQTSRNSQSDRPIATGQVKFLGSAWSEAQSDGFAAYWNQVTPENGG
jgi:hypothetical protein